MSPILFDHRLDKIHNFGILTEYSVGRSNSCQVHILDTQVSRFQCTFVKTVSEDGETEWKIENKSSFRTTYVNGVQVGTVGVVLKTGDIVSLGVNHVYKYTFYLDESEMPPKSKRRRLSNGSQDSGAAPELSGGVETRKRKKPDTERSKPEVVQEISRPSPLRDFDIAPVHPEAFVDDLERVIGGDLEPVIEGDLESVIGGDLQSAVNVDREAILGINSQPIDFDLDNVKLPEVGEQTMEEFVSKCKLETFGAGKTRLLVTKSVETLTMQLYKALLEKQKLSESVSQLKNRLEATEEKKAEAVQLLLSANEETSKMDNDLVDALEEIDRLAKERSEYLEEVKTLSLAAQQQQSSSELETELVFKAIENEELVNENTELKTNMADLQQKFDAVQSVGEQVKNDVITLIEQEFFCAVCNDSLYHPVTINCRHTFCSDCLREWKKKKLECPSCRTRITAETSPLIIDNFIDRVAPVLGGDFVEKRREAISERTAPPPTVAPPPRRGGRRPRRSARGRRAMDAPAGGGDLNFGGARALARYISDIIDLV